MDHDARLRGHRPAGHVKQPAFRDGRPAPARLRPGRPIRLGGTGRVPARAASHRRLPRRDPRDARGVLVMPEQERAATLSRIRAFLDGRPETADGEFVLPLLTGVLRVRPG